MAVRVISAILWRFCISSEFLNSWGKEKCPPSMKLNNIAFCILVTSSSPLDYILLSFIVFYKISFRRQNVTAAQMPLPMDYIKMTHLRVFATQCNHVFILEYIVESHFVSVLKTLSWAPNCSVEMVVHHYPQKIWYLDFCREWSFSVLFRGRILPQKFFCE